LVTDLTAQRQYAQLIVVNQALQESEARLRDADKRRALLVNELNHRVKNTLSLVQSLAHQTMRNSKSTEDMRMTFETRLTALAKAHDLLTRNYWEGADFSEIVAEAIAPFRDGLQARFEVTGPRIQLLPKAVWRFPWPCMSSPQTQQNTARFRTERALFRSVSSFAG
jgi:two-component sensor histidine kinase